MKNKTRFSTIGLLLSLFISQAALAQSNFIKGYVVSKEGDTINGYIHQKHWIVHPTTVSFKKTLSGDAKRYFPNEIKEFKVGEDIFRSALVEVEESKRVTEGSTTVPEFQITEKQAFIKALYLGPKSLFYLRSSMEIKNFYIEIDGKYILLRYKQYVKYENGNQRIIEKRNYIGQLVYYFDKCEKIRVVLNKTDYEIKQLKKAFRKYYECAPYDYTYKAIKQKIKVNSRLIAGAVFSSIEFTGMNPEHYLLTRGDYSNSRQSAFGFSLNIVAPNTEEKWIIRNELMFSSFATSGIYEKVNEPDRRLWFESDIEVMFVRMTHMLQFTPAMGSDFGLLFGIGPSYGINSMGKNTVIRKELSHDYFYDQKFEALREHGRMGAGAVAAAGVSYRRWTLELRGEFYSDLSSTDNLNAPIQSLYILTSFRL